LFLKVGILAIIGELVILLASLIKEQLFVRKKERCNETEK